jgi:RNA polymerase sigma-70 factor, ECF subfamily
MAGRDVSTDDEPALVARYRATGDVACFEELYRRERRKVYGICLRVLRDTGEAEDVCHDAFVKAFERFETLVGDAFAPWICKIATNLSLNRLRFRLSRRTDGAYREEEQPGSDAEARAIAEQELSKAAGIVNALRDEQRRVFLLRQLDGLGYREISARTGFSEDAVRSHLQNARRNFQLAWRARPSHAAESRHG